MWPLTGSPAATLCKVTKQRRLAQALAVKWAALGAPSAGLAAWQTLLCPPLL